MAHNRGANSMNSRSFETSRVAPVEGRLPSWYYRVSQLVAGRDLESNFESPNSGPHPRDFDEDISDLNSDEEASSCHCPSDGSECECEPDPDDLDLETDEEFYFEYKEMREERKEQIQQRRKIIERAIKNQARQEEEVGKAWIKAHDRESQGIEGRELKIKSAHFNLYSSEYMRSLPLFSDQGTIYIEFYPSCERDGSLEDTQLIGHIYFNGSNVPELAAFRAPEYTGLSGIDVDLRDSDARITVTFVDQHFMKVAIPRHIALGQPSPSETPDFLEFCGISLDLEKERKRKREGEEDAEGKRQRQRAISPKESWFEMTHSMGSWAQSRR